MTRRFILFLPVLLLTLGLPAAAIARLNETIAETQERYGAPSDAPGVTAQALELASAVGLGLRERPPGFDYRGFLHNDWIVVVFYLDGKSVCESYRDATSLQMKQEDIVKLLKANAGDREWRRVKREGDDQFSLKWVLVSGPSDAQPKSDATAILNGATLTVTATRFTNRLD